MQWAAIHVQIILLLLRLFYNITGVVPPQM